MSGGGKMRLAVAEVRTCGECGWTSSSWRGSRRIQNQDRCEHDEVHPAHIRLDLAPPDWCPLRRPR